MRKSRGLVSAILIFFGCACSSGTIAQTNPPAQSAPIGTTTFPRLGGRKIAAFRCRVELATGKVNVDHPKDLEKDEEASWNDLSDQISRDGRTFKILIEDNKDKNMKGTPPRFRDWVRVSITECDSKTKELVRTIPIQEFKGEHEDHGPRAFVLKDGLLRFWMQFWTND